MCYNFVQQKPHLKVANLHEFFSTRLIKFSSCRIMWIFLQRPIKDCPCLVPVSFSFLALGLIVSLVIINEIITAVAVLVLAFVIVILAVVALTLSLSLPLSFRLSLSLSFWLSFSLSF